MAELYEFKNETQAALMEARSEFLASLVLKVLKNMLKPRPGKKVADLAIYEYERQRDRYLDDPAWEDLLVPSDKWVKQKSIFGALAKRRIEAVINESGWYIARPPGEGIFLTKDTTTIKADYERSGRAMKSRADRMSFVASQMNGKLGTELPATVLQFLQLTEA